MKGSRIRKPVPPPTRRVFGGGSRETEQRLVRWGTVSKFSKGRRGFNPCFGKAEKIRTVRVNKV